jgi:hypothetical protein
MGKTIAKKPAAPAWVSGGSSEKPRIGKPYVGARTKHAREGPTQKSGATRLRIRVAYKKPAVAAKVPYVPAHQQKESGPHFQVRDSASKAKVRLETIMRRSELQNAKCMWKMGHLSKLTCCGKCKGPLKPVAYRCKQLVRKCRRKKCGKYNKIQEGSPVFWASKGISFVSLKQQACMLHCAAWNVPQSLVPSLIEGIQRKSVDHMYKNFRKLIQQYVIGKQESIKFGQPAGSVDVSVPLDECEWDEAVFRKEDKPHHQVEWTEYAGGKRRGDRASLFFKKRRAANSMSTRSENGRACPPPMTRDEWVEIRDARVGAGALSHTDGAPAYISQREGARHDSVSHNHKHGKKPEYTKVTTHTDLAGRKVQAVGGTQCLDGWWTHGKRAIFGTKAGNHDGVDAHVRAEQWRHWIGSQDRWEALGAVIQWIPE